MIAKLPKLRISLPMEEIAAFCQRHHIRRLAFFGSVLRDDFRLDSDVDVLVEFEPGHTPGLITLAGMEIELSGLLRRKADLRTPADLSRVGDALTFEWLADSRGERG